MEATMMRFYLKSKNAVKKATESNLKIEREKGDDAPYVEIPFDLYDQDWDRAKELFETLGQDMISRISIKFSVYKKELFRQDGQYCIPNTAAEATCQTDGNPTHLNSQAVFFKAGNVDELKTIYLQVRGGKLYPVDDFEAPQVQNPKDVEIAELKAKLSESNNETEDLRRNIVELKREIASLEADEYELEEKNKSYEKTVLNLVDTKKRTTDDWNKERALREELKEKLANAGFIHAFKNLPGKVKRFIENRIYPTQG